MKAVIMISLVSGIVWVFWMTYVHLGKRKKDNKRKPPKKQ